MHIEDPSADLITVAEIAEWFGIHKTNARRWLLKEGFTFRFIRLEETGNQLSAALSRKEADQAIARRKQRGFRVKHDLPKHDTAK